MSQFFVSTVNFAGMMALTAMAFGLTLKVVSGRTARQVIFGLILGFGAAVVSLQPVMSINGLQIDPRNLFVGCAGAFAGPLAGMLSFIIAAATRYYEGGATANVCVISLFVATSAGLVWRVLTRNSEKIDQRHLSALGLTISLSYFCTFLLPREYWSAVFSSAVPFLTMVNVIGTLILGGFLERERRRELRERSLRDQASVDPLTGLRNRRAFEAAYYTSVFPEKSTGTACILIDLDHFKRINDTYGHAAGDRVLISVSEKLNAGVRDGDLTARFGGEEFAICLPNTSREQAVAIAQRLRRTMSEIDDVKTEFGVSVTASLGICWCEMPMDMEAAFALADQALYQAKLNGRDQVVINDRSVSTGQAVTFAHYPSLARPTAVFNSDLP